MRRLAAAALACLAFAGSARAEQVREVWVHAVNYPAGVAPGPREYRVRLRYELTPDGRIASCTIDRSRGQPLLDAESCRIFQARARIMPVRGINRGKVEFAWQGASSLELPGVRGAPLPFALRQNITPNDYPVEAAIRHEGGATQYEVDVSATGRPTACRVTHSSGSTRLDERTCFLVMTRGAFIPAADGAGTDYGRITWRAP